MLTKCVPQLTANSNVNNESIMQHDDKECNLNDRFAHPTGVLNCLREDAADIGFVDHWTAWGAGQGALANQNATLRNMSELKAVCNDGCRNLIQAIEVRLPRFACTRKNPSLCARGAEFEFEVRSARK